MLSYFTFALVALRPDHRYGCSAITNLGFDKGKKLAFITKYGVNPTQAQCRIFSTTFNPEGTRTGNKVLRQRLKGPALAAYYPRRTATLRDLRTAYPDLETWDEDEEDRLENIQL